MERMLKVIMVLGLMLYGCKSQSSCLIIQDAFRIDCHPHPNMNESSCLERGCCWKDPLAGSDTDAPKCYYPAEFSPYRIDSMESIKDGMKYTIVKDKPSYVPKDILRLDVYVTFVQGDIARVRIIDPANERFEVPYVFSDEASTSPKNTMFDLTITNDPFAILIKNKRTGDIIFNSRIGPLIYSDQFIQISTLLPSHNVYGLGEHRNSYKLQTTWQTLAFWNRDQPPVINHNLYGTQPVAMFAGKEGNKYGIFMLNSNAMDAVLQPAPALTFRTIGGVIDLFIYAGPTAFDVVRQHYTIVQRPHFQPYWALGFHLCRYGYKDINEVRDVYNRMKFIGFPYDIQWTDIDAMKNRLVFTFDDVNWSGLPEFVHELHRNNMKYTPINDPCIGINLPEGMTYPALEEGLKNDVFIRDSTGELLVGRVWPGDCYFPDFTSPKAVEWWGNEIEKFNATAPFDGFWIDMNEPASFVPGSVKGCPASELNDPWYVPKVIGNLYEKTVCPSALQVMSNQYNLHNLYGFIESKVTFEAITNLTPEKRHFVLSRSTFAGSGHYAGHWTGDNWSTWSDLYYSINEMFNFNLFGLPFVGADICGFFDDTNEELCTRWMQLGAFYPFMRNHNTINVVPQDPTVFSEPARQAMLVALYWRYRLIPFYYTLSYESHMNLRPIINSLMFLYENDFVCETLDTQFVIGTSIMVAPVLNEKATSINIYFPDDTWFDLNTFENVGTTGWITIPVDINSVPMYIRRGSIVPTHIITKGKNAIENRDSKFLLYVVLHPTKMATGNLFWDDGESVNGSSTMINFLAFDQLLSINAVLPPDPYIQPLIVDEIVIIGLADSHVRNPTVNGASKPFSLSRGALLIHNVASNMNSEDPVTVRWEYFV
uniref:alpha-glucosidase n=1 Tax=Fundulus heteroclitus TaxID=8078 RepID=A0A146UTA2_FUNHE